MSAQVEVASEFMQSYRYGTPFVNDTQIAVVAGPGGTSSVVSIGSDGHLYAVTPDEATDTGWSILDLTTTGGGVNGAVRRCDLAVDASGNPHLAVVVASDDPTSDSLYYVRDLSPSPTYGRWNFCGRTSQTTIPAVSIAIGADQAPLAVITTTDNAAGTTALSTVALAPASVPPPWTPLPTSQPVQQVLAAVVATASGSLGVFVSYLDRAGGAHLEFVTVLGGVTTPVGGPRTYTRLALAGDGALFAAAATDLFYDDPNLGFTAIGSVPAAVAQLLAARNPRSTYDVYALTIDGRLFHCIQGRQDPEEIESQVAHAAADDSVDGTEVLFYVEYANALYASSVDEQSGDWSPQQVEVVVDRTVESFPSYSTVLTFTDAKLAPVPFADVALTSSSLAGAYVNGEALVLDAATPATVTTNGAGQVVLATKTQGLATATLTVSAGFLPAGTTVEVHQNADLQQRLRSIQSGDLLDAARRDGTKLLAGAFATEAVATALQQGLNNAMSLAEPPPPAPPTANMTVRNINTAAGRLASPAGPGRLHLPSVPVQYWELDFTSGVPVYRDHTADSIAPHLAGAPDTARLLAAGAVMGSAGGWSWGDLWDAVESGVVELGHLFVSTVVDPVTTLVSKVVATIEDLVGNVLWNGAVDLLEQAFDVVEGVFNTVKVYFDDLFDWLGFLFDWDDILRTKDAISYAFQQFIPYVQDAVQHVKDQALGGIATLQGQMSSYFDQAVSQLGVQTILGKQQTDERPADDVRATSVHNIAFTGFLNNATGATALGPATSPLAQDVLQSLESLVGTVTGYVQQFQSTQAFENALTYFERIQQSPDQFLQLALAGLLEVVEGVALLGLDLAATALGLLLDGVTAVLGGVLALLQAPWDIPWVSDLYASVTDGGTLCVLDLLALVLAIPTTVLYKAWYQVAPFPSDADSTSFQTGFTTQSILSWSGMAGARPAAQALAAASPRGLAQAQQATAEGSQPSTWNTLFNVVGIVNSFFYGAVEAVTDIFPPDPVQGGFQVGSLNPEFQKIHTQWADGVGALSAITWSMQWTGQLFSLPWVAGDGGDIGCADDTELGNLIWVLQNVGAGYDTVWFFVTRAVEGNGGRIARNAGDIGVFVDTLYGCCHLGLMFWWAIENGWKDGVTISQNFFSTLPEFTKLGRATQVVEATEGFSLAACAACDVIGDWTAMGLSVAKLGK